MVALYTLEGEVGSLKVWLVQFASLMLRRIAILGARNLEVMVAPPPHGCKSRQNALPIKCSSLQGATFIGNTFGTNHQPHIRFLHMKVQMCSVSERRVSASVLGMFQDSECVITKL